MWWHIPVIVTPGRWRQEAVRASMGYITNPNEQFRANMGYITNPNEEFRAGMGYVTNPTRSSGLARVM